MLPLISDTSNLCFFPLFSCSICPLLPNFVDFSKESGFSFDFLYRFCFRFHWVSFWSIAFFLLLTLSLISSFFPDFLRWLFSHWFEIFFLIESVKAIKFPLSIVLTLWTVSFSSLTAGDRQCYLFHMGAWSTVLSNSSEWFFTNPQMHVEINTQLNTL